MRKNGITVMIAAAAMAALTIFGATGLTAHAANVGDIIDKEYVKYEITKLPSDGKDGRCKVVGCDNSLQSAIIYRNIGYEDANYVCNEMEPGAFQGKKNLTYVKLNELSAITTIPKNAFADCKNLKTVEILTDDLDKIEKKAFLRCTKLSTLILAGDDVTIKKKSFKKVDELTVYCPKDSIEIYEYMIEMVGGADDVTALNIKNR